MAQRDRQDKSNGQVDPEATSMFPAGGMPNFSARDGLSDADSWVAQWSDQSDNGGDDAVGAASPEPGTPDAAEIAAWQKSQERARRRAKLRANHRMAKTVTRYRPRPDEIHATAPFRLSGERQGSGGRRLVALGAVVLTATLAVVGYLLVLSDTGGVDDDVAVPADPPTPDLEVSAEVVPIGVQEVARSTIQLVGLDDNDDPVCAGSGVIVEPDGTMLTNAHVVTRTEACPFRSIGVAVTEDSTSPARLLYRADLLVVDARLDLAVLRISGPLDPDAGDSVPDRFPAAPLGDSDTVNLGDDIRILGFPVIGGDTITLTNGTVSGFSSEVGIGDRALIKTDAAISSGNSGGMAIDSTGRIIGIPTKARASESGPAIDCRPVTDTNEDGQLDDADGCVPVGGFLNGVRPINLAGPILAIAASADPIVPPVGRSPQARNFDPTTAVFSNPRFSLGHEGNVPVEEIATATAGVAELCFFVDWDGIPAGVNVEGAWFIDGELEPAFSQGQRQWNLAEAGRNFWLCASEQDALGLPSGVYEVGFYIEGELVFAEGIALTPEPVEVVTITWTNELETDLCGLAINPRRSGRVGLNELEDGVVIAPGDSVTTELPIGVVVVEAYDCDGEAVADELTGLSVTKDQTFAIGL